MFPKIRVPLRGYGGVVWCYIRTYRVQGPGNRARVSQNWRSL